jgi:hypothetical protein
MLAVHNVATPSFVTFREVEALARRMAESKELSLRFPAMCAGGSDHEVKLVFSTEGFGAALTQLKWAGCHTDPRAAQQPDAADGAGELERRR